MPALDNILFLIGIQVFAAVVIGVLFVVWLTTRKGTARQRDDDEE